MVGAGAVVAHLDLVNFRAISLGFKNGILARGAIAKDGANPTGELTAAGRAVDSETQACAGARDGFAGLRREVACVSKRYQMGG